jgi:hypothetical protein
VNGSHGFIPANYVQEIEHKLVSVEVKKPVVIKDVRKVKRTQYVKQANPPANQRSGTGSLAFGNLFKKREIPVPAMTAVRKMAQIIIIRQFFFSRSGRDAFHPETCF